MMYEEEYFGQYFEMDADQKNVLLEMTIDKY